MNMTVGSFGFDGSAVNGCLDLSCSDDKKSNSNLEKLDFVKALNVNCQMNNESKNSLNSKLPNYNNGFIDVSSKNFNHNIRDFSHVKPRNNGNSHSRCLVGGHYF